MNINAELTKISNAQEEELFPLYKKYTGRAESFNDTIHELSAKEKRFKKPFRIIGIISLVIFFASAIGGIVLLALKSKFAAVSLVGIVIAYTVVAIMDEYLSSITNDKLNAITEQADCLELSNILKKMLNI